jgi:hypothetical protein
VNPGGEVHSPKVHVVKHEGRFINLQRLLLKPSVYGRSIVSKAAKALVAGETSAFVKADEVTTKFTWHELHHVPLFHL